MCAFEKLDNEIAGRKLLFDEYKNHVIPQSIKFDPLTHENSYRTLPDNLENVFASHQISRYDFIHNFGYCLICGDWIQPLSKWLGKRNCLEVGCGSGILACALRTYGVNVIATDDFSWHNTKWEENLWVDDMYGIDAVDAVNLYGRGVDIVIMSWPPMGVPMASNVLAAARHYDLPILYIGEGAYGCTGDIQFNQSLAQRFKPDQPGIVTVNEMYPNWYSIYDSVSVIH